VLAKAFCQEYPINQEDIEAGKPGLLIGRYPGDSYAGGNPWQLLTAVYAEVFYLGGQATYKEVAKRGDFSLRYSEYKEWIDLLRLEEGATAGDLARAQVAAGDAVMTSLWSRVQDADGRMDEQIDKHTGAQASAQGLTWSYANILHALHVRKNLSPDPNTTPRPTDGPGPTDGPTDQTTDGPQPTATTEEPVKSCCNAVKFVSTGAIGDKFSQFVGKYNEDSIDATGKRVFKKIDDEIYLHYAKDVHFKFEAWLFSAEVGDTVADVVNENVNNCADEPGQSWTYLEGDDWIEDTTAQVLCDGSNVECCSTLSVKSSGAVAEQYPEYLGVYASTKLTRGGQPVYTHVNGGLYLYFLEDVPHHYKGWTIAESLTELGGVSLSMETDCPHDIEDGVWEYVDAAGNWNEDPSFTVKC